MEGHQLPSSSSTTINMQQFSSPPSLLTESLSFSSSISLNHSHHHHHHQQQLNGDSNDNQQELINQHEIKSSPDIWSNNQTNVNDNWSYYSSPYLQINTVQDYLQDDSCLQTNSNQTEQIDLPESLINNQSTDLNLSSSNVVTDNQLSSSPPATIQQLLSSSPSSPSTETYSLSTPMENHFTSITSQDQQQSPTTVTDFCDNQQSQQFESKFESSKCRQEKQYNHHSSPYQRWNNNPHLNTNGVWPYCSQICQIHGTRNYPPYYNPYMVCNRSNQVYYQPSSSSLPPTHSSIHQSAVTEFQLSSSPPLPADTYTSLDAPCSQQFNSIQSRQESANNEMFSPCHRWATSPPCQQHCHAAQHYPHYPTNMRCNRPPQQPYYQPLPSLQPPIHHQHALSMTYQGTSDVQLASLSQNQGSPSSMKMATMLKKKKTNEKTIKKRKKCDN